MYEGGSKGEREATAPSAGVGAGLARRTACLRPAGWPIGMLDLCELAANAGNRPLAFCAAEGLDAAQLRLHVLHLHEHRQHVLVIAGVALRKDTFLALSGRGAT